MLFFRFLVAKLLFIQEGDMAELLLEQSKIRTKKIQQDLQRLKEVKAAAANTYIRPKRWM